MTGTVVDHSQTAYRRPVALAFWLIVGFIFVLLVTPTKTSASWQAEWDQTLEAAKKEGQVNVFSGPAAGLTILQAGVFQKRFPDIKLVGIVGRNPVNRILAERRAGKPFADVIIGGARTTYQLYRGKALDPLQDSIIFPEIRDQSLWWKGKHHYIDPERKYILALIGIPDTGNLAYNPKVVNLEEIRSYWDILAPRWKGKLSARDIRIPGVGATSTRIFYYNPKLGPEFVRKLFGEMDITLFRDGAQGVNWLASGKFPICFFCTSSEIARAKKQGLPINEFPVLKEGAGFTFATGNVSMGNRASPSQRSQSVCKLASFPRGAAYRAAREC